MRNADSCPETSRFSRRAQAALAAALVCALTAGAEAGPIPDNPRYTFTPIGDELGLVSRAPYSIIEDSEGFVWVAVTGGTYRFVGLEGMKFDSLDVGFITQIVEAPDGTIWGAGMLGVARFDGASFVPLESEKYNWDLRKSDQFVRQRIGFTSTNVMYVAVETGLLAFDLKSNESKLYPAQKVQAVHVDDQDRVWFVAGGQVGVLRHATGEVELTPLPDEVTGEPAVALLTDGSGTVWLRTLHHLLARAPGAKGFEIDESLVAHSEIYGLPSLDRSGELLVPSSDGLYYRESGEWKLVSERHGLRKRAVTCAYEDREGGLWIGGLAIGIQRWAGRGEWLAWTEDEGLPRDFVAGSLRDSRGRLWVSTFGGVAIWLPDEREWRTLTVEDGLVGENVHDLLVGPDGWIWATSYKQGITRIDPESLAVERVDLPPEVGNDVHQIAAGPDGTIWGVTWDALFTARLGGEELVIEEVRGTGTTPGYSVAVADDGAVWCGGSGLARFDGGAWRSFDEPELFSGETVLITAVSGQEVWFGTTKPPPVKRLRLTESGPELTGFDIEQGLMDDISFGFELDSRGRTWVSHTNGISVINPDNSITIIDHWDGLIFDDITGNGFMFEPDGGVFIGTSGGGLAYYKPSRDKKQSPPPEAVILEAALGGEDVLGEDKPRAKQEDGSFNVRFAGLTYGNPRRIGFKYRMVGLDDEEVETQDRAVRYAALPPGDYRFEVWCKSAAGVWSAAPATFAFAVEGIWWQDWWVRGGAVIVLVVLFFAYVLLRSRARRAR